MPTSTRLDMGLVDPLPLHGAAHTWADCHQLGRVELMVRGVSVSVGSGVSNLTRLR
jgi:hypothetical protein